jgi:hypothetical protein
MNINKSNTTFRNAMVFTIISFIYLASVQSLIGNISLFSFVALKEFLKHNYLTIFVGLTTLYLIFRFNKISIWAFILLSFMIAFKSFIFLSMSFNKLVLSLNFIYIIFAFYFYTDWELFLESAGNTPNYQTNDLEIESRFTICGHLKNQNQDNVEFKLTNIDKRSCFVLFADRETKINIGDKYTMTINYENVVFESEIECISLYGFGAGFTFLKEENNLRDLSGLYKVCLDRGLYN